MKIFGNLCMAIFFGSLEKSEKALSEPPQENTTPPPPNPDKPTQSHKSSGFVFAFAFA